MRGRLFVVSVAAALSVGVVAASPVAAVVPGDDGLIAFAYTSDGNLGSIATIAPDGTGLTELPSDDGVQDFAPAWSPDGGRIAYVRYREGDSSDLWIMDADGADRTRVTRNARFDHDPAWSPDGTALVFARISRTHTPHLWVKVLGGPPPVRISPAGYAGHPDWSPDGSTIVFQRRGGDLWTIAPDGSSLARLTETELWESHARWSPDGTELAFGGDPAGADTKADIYVMDADGSNVRRVTETPASYEIEPAWSPSGARIAYIAGDLQLWVIGADGSDPVPLIGPSATDPDWQTAPYVS